MSDWLPRIVLATMFATLLGVATQAEQDADPKSCL